MKSILYYLPILLLFSVFSCRNENRSSLPVQTDYALEFQKDILSDSDLQNTLSQLSLGNSVKKIDFGLVRRSKEDEHPWYFVYYTYKHKELDVRNIFPKDSTYWHSKVLVKFPNDVFEKTEYQKITDFYDIHNTLSSFTEFALQKKNERLKYIEYRDCREDIPFVNMYVVLRRENRFFLIVHAPDYSNKEYADWLSKKFRGTVNTEKYYDIGQNWVLYTFRSKEAFSIYEQ